MNFSVPADMYSVRSISQCLVKGSINYKLIYIMLFHHKIINARRDNSDESQRVYLLQILELLYDLPNH